jgi:hypothetical protein
VLEIPEDRQYTRWRESSIYDDRFQTASPSITLSGIISSLVKIGQAADFINIVTGVMRDVVPAMALLRSLVYLLASLTVNVFFYVFQKAQSWSASEIESERKSGLQFLNRCRSPSSLSRSRSNSALHF